MAYTRTPSLLDKEKAELVGPILNRLLLSIEREINQEPHPGLIIARHDFFEPYPTCSQIDLLSLSAMQLLIKFAYPALSGYAKFTVVLTRKLSSGAEVTFTIGPAIPLVDSDGIGLSFFSFCGICLLVLLTVCILFLLNYVSCFPCFELSSFHQQLSH